MISFGPWDTEGIYVPHNDALVIQDKVTNYEVKQGYKLELLETCLFGFVGHAVYPKGEIMLPLIVKAEDLRRTIMTTFTVVNASSSYNIILERQTMNALMVVASTYH
ncbi:uncharacterized protein [Primulina huaijiensis]|uniref:uncharacterized protein n=1 Tax=Primulina huaijiensis TaxID=1492673 RepID=UPI003CC76C42